MAPRLIALSADLFEGVFPLRTEEQTEEETDKNARQTSAGVQEADVWVNMEASRSLGITRERRCKTCFLIKRRNQLRLKHGVSGSSRSALQGRTRMTRNNMRVYVFSTLNI